MIVFIFLCLFFFLGAEAGASWSWSSRWQTNKFKKKLPEIALAALLAGISHIVYQAFSLNGWWLHGLTLAAFFVHLAGIESATWSFLKWEKHVPNLIRSFTLKRVVDWLAWRIGWILQRNHWTIGDEGYSWVAATVKGTIICLPFSGPFAPIGGLFFAFGYEVGSHFKDRITKFNPHIISEGMSLAFVGAFAMFVLSMLV